MIIHTFQNNEETGRFSLQHTIRTPGCSGCLQDYFKRFQDFLNHFLVVFQGFQANLLLIIKVFNSITFRIKRERFEFLETEIHVRKFQSIQT